MLRQLKTICVAFFAAALSTGAATAAPIFADQPYTFGTVLSNQFSTAFSFEVAEDLDIASFVVNATDTNGGSDIISTTFSYNVVSGATFDTVFSSSGTLGDPGATGTGFSFIPGWGGYATGDVINFAFNAAVVDDVSLGLSFQTTQPTSVPIPATGALLLTALGAVALRKRRFAL